LYIKIAKRFIKYQIYLFKSIELLITLLNFSLALQVNQSYNKILLFKRYLYINFSF